MKTRLYENGDTFEMVYRLAKTTKNGKKYIMIDNVLHELISKVKTNKITITDVMSERVKPQN